MTWFNHTCWYCGHRSKHMSFIVGDGNYQCAWEVRSACEQRRRQRDAAILAALSSHRKGTQ